MGLFGGGGSQKTTTKMTRPDYIQKLIDSLANQSQTTNQGEYVDQQYVGLNQDEIDALKSLKDSSEINNLANTLMSGGQQGVDTLNQAYGQLQNLYQNGNITPDQISDLAGQLYDQQAVDSAINAQNEGIRQGLAQNTLTNVAQQTMQGGGGGSSSRMAKDMAKSAALSQMQQGASDLTNQAYNNAMEQANSILSGNRQQQYSALGALSQSGSNLAGLANTGANLSNQANVNALKAGNVEQADLQAQLENQYQNQMNKQNYGWNQINNQMNAANILNASQGQQTSSTTSGGGSGILGGAMSGAAAGSAFGPWGALAGGVLGALSSS